METYDRMTPLQAERNPRVAIIIPVYKHPGFVAEAIDSALKQETSIPYRVVIVNDGCPFAETHHVCSMYARAYPEKVVYVRRNNAGLGAARNTGVEIALTAWKSIEALFLLDADNRMLPHLLQRYYDALIANPNAGWIFTDLSGFGRENAFLDMSGDFRVLQMLCMNYCDAGSMVRREIFARGASFYQGMKLGYEDWDLWLQAIEMGYRGKHLPAAGFRYRLRAESMVTELTREHANTANRIRARHPDLYSPQRVLQIEQLEAPRYAIFLSGSDEIALTTDPRNSQRKVSVAEFSDSLLKARRLPRTDHVPPFIVATTAAFLDHINTCRVAPALFWNMQEALEKADICCVTAECVKANKVEFEFLKDPPLHCRSSTICMMRTSLLQRVSDDRNQDMLSVLSEWDGEFTFSRLALRITHPTTGESFASNAGQSLAGLFHRLRAAHADAPLTCFHSDLRVCRQNIASDEVERKLFNSQLLPVVPNTGEIHIGYVVPLSEFSGVERVVHNYGRETRRLGWHPHLFIVGNSRAQLLAEFADTFDTVNTIPHGVGIEPQRLAGLLSGMEVVVNAHSAAANQAMGLLRMMGKKTFAQLHVVDRSPDGLAYGVPYEVLSYEHVYDGILVISDQLKQWCRAWGVPESKVAVARNAPSFEISEALVESILAGRVSRAAGEKLNVLFMGRLDPQKGLDRMAKLVEVAQRRSSPVNWRFVGKSVTSGAENESFVTSLKPWLHAPALTADELIAQYQWADVLILLSRYEGVPLSILEAQRLGCVTCATAVGAVNEIVDDGVTGFLFPNDIPAEKLAEDVLNRLEKLQLDRRLLLNIGTASADLRRNASWTQTLQPFFNAVRGMIRRESRK